MSIASRFGSAIVDALGRRDSESLYRVCRKIVHRYNGDNDGDMHTNGEHTLMRRVLPGMHVAFDVGANVGEWTQEALAINPRAHYHLFEPSPSTFTRLQEREFPPNVTLNNLGLSAAEGELELFVFGEGLGANSLYDRRGTDAVEQRRERVRLTTVDGYCALHGIQHIDFLKIDVEGHELSVLRGASEMIRARRVALIQFEYGGTYIDARALLKDVWDLVLTTSPTYAFFKLHHDGPRHVPSYRQEHESFQYSNWVIMAKDHPAAARG